MFNDSVSFNGGTRVEVIAVLANCGRDTDKARRALVTWIRHKQAKGRNTEHILIKLRDIESKFIKYSSLHSAFRDARAETFLPRAPDLPLPYSVRRNSEARSTISMPSPSSAGPSSVFPPFVVPPTVSPQQTSSSTAHSLSRDSESLPGESDTPRRVSLPQAVPHAPQPRSPRIQIPRNPPPQPHPNSPLTSSPEASERHLRYRFISDPLGSPFRSPASVYSQSSPAQSPSSPIPSHYQNPGRRPSSGPTLLVPTPRIRIPRPQSQRSHLSSPRSSSPEASDARPRHHHHKDHPTALVIPGRRRVTPPRTSPPKIPLPSIPADGQEADSRGDTFKTGPPAEQPPTPVRSAVFPPSTPVHPLPIQPVPSPIPDSDESGHSDIINGNSLRRFLQESNVQLVPSDDVVRQDSPVYVFHDDHADSTGIGPPPPYADPVDPYSPPDTPIIGEALERALNVCGGSPEVRSEVSKCIGFHRGYEPPYWQTRLQACGLNAEAAKYLVDRMSKQVDWGASFGRIMRC